MRRVVLLAGLLGVATTACVGSSSTFCADGTICRGDTVCASVTVDEAAATFCVEPGQLASCRDAPSGSACTVDQAPGTCHDGACLANACGNRLVDLGESCDDGNTTAGDGCAAACDSSERCGNGTVDLLRLEQCDDGNLRSHDGCSSTCQREAPIWMDITDSHPGARAYAAVAYDLARRRIVSTGGNRAGVLVGGVYEYNGVRWERPATTFEPSPEFDMAMAFDPVRERLVLVTSSGMYERDPAGQWTVRSPSPRPNQPSAAVYDARHARIFVLDREHVATWSWDGTVWTSRPLPPGLNGRASMAYDEARGVIVVFGGRIGNVVTNQLWELDGDTWTDLRSVPNGPSARELSAMTYDPVTRQVLVIGGEGQTPLDTTSETWGWNGTRWQQYSDAVAFGAVHVIQAAAVTDRTRGRAVLVGPNSDVQVFDGGSWIVEPPPSGPALLSRSYFAAAVDQLHQELVVVGGTISHSTFTAVDELDLWDGAWHTPMLSGPRPPATFAASLVYDEARGELVLFGGCDQLVAYGETWIWRDHTWIKQALTTAPPARCYHASTYDPVGKRVLVFGGLVGGQVDNSTWAWDGTAWTELAPPQRPPARKWAAMAFDEARGKAVLFGGDTNGPILDDTWTFDGATWTREAPATSPGARTNGGMVYDARIGRILMFGGVNIPGTVDELWSWDGATWTRLVSAVSPGSRATVFTRGFDGTGGLLVSGYGYHNGIEESFDDVWRLRWDSASAVELCTDRDFDGDSLVACDDPDCATRCMPADESGCGDGVCNPYLEACYACAADCGPCP